MKEFTTEEIQQAYRGASGQVQDFLFTEETALAIAKVCAALNIPDEKKSIVAEEVLFAVLKLTNNTEFFERFGARLGLDRERAAGLIQQLDASVWGSYVKNLTMTPPKADSSLKERLALRPEESGVPPPPNGEVRTPGPGPTEGAKPLTKEELLSSLSPKHTMKEDIAAAKGGSIPGSGGVGIPKYSKPFLNNDENPT